MTQQSFRNAFNAFHEKLRNPSSLLGASFNLLIGQSIGFITLFLIDLWLVRELSRTDFGTWKQFIWLMRFIIPFLFLGFPDSYRYFSAIERKDSTKHFISILIILLIIGLFLQILYFFDVLSVIEVLTQNIEFNLVLAYIPLLFVFAALKVLSRIHAIFIHKTKTIIIANLLFSLFLVLCLFLFFLNGMKALLSILLAWLIADSIRVVYYFVSNNLICKIKKKYINLSKSIVLKYVRYGFPYYISTTIFLIFMNVDKTIVSVFSGVESFAAFSVAAVEIPFLPAIFVSVAQNMFPRLADLWLKNPEEAFDMWFRAFKKVSYLVFPVIILLLWIARPLFVLAYTEKFVDGLPVFRVYLLLLIWRTASYSSLLNAGGKPQLNMWLNSLFLIINIILSYLFYESYGIMGVVWATFVSFSLLNITILVSLKKLNRFYKLILSDKKMIVLMLLIIGSYIFSETYA